MGYREDQRLDRLQSLNVGELDTILLVGVGRRGERIVYLYQRTKRMELTHDIDDRRVSDVGDVFLKRQAEYGDHLGCRAIARHAPDAFTRHALPDAVIDSPAGENHFGIVASLFRAVSEVVGINAYAMTAH